MHLSGRSSTSPEDKLLKDNPALFCRGPCFSDRVTFCHARIMTYRKRFIGSLSMEHVWTASQGIVGFLAMQDRPAMWKKGFAVFFRKTANCVRTETEAVIFWGWRIEKWMSMSEWFEAFQWKLLKLSLTWIQAEHTRCCLGRTKRYIRWIEITFLSFFFLPSLQLRSVPQWKEDRCSLIIEL